MARLSLGALALLVSAIPGRTWSLVFNAEEMKPHSSSEEEDNTLRHTAFRKNRSADVKEERRKYRQLDADRGPSVTWIEGQSPVQVSDTKGQAVSDRDYLNALVETSAANTDNQEVEVVFFKTHKTGSTTMGSLLYRYAVRHGLKLADFGQATSVKLPSLADKVEKGELQRADIMHYHISLNGRLEGSWSNAHKNYLRIMQKPDDAMFISVVREPRSHFISFYYYFLYPVNKLSLEEFLKKQRKGSNKLEGLRNLLSLEFGVTTLTQMDHLIAHELSSFNLIFLTERFDEGLMLVRRMLGWSMIDMTYIALNETKPGSKRWDGKALGKTPSYDDLPKQVQNQVDEFTMLDQMLYTAVQEEYVKRLQPTSNVIEADMEEFKELQGVVNDYLSANDSSKANAMYRTHSVYKDTPPMYPF